MSQEIAHRDPRFSRLGELGPVARDRCVEVEQAGLDEPEGADGGDRFPDGVEVDDRVAVPGSRPRGVGVPRPQIDNRALFDVDGEGGAHLGAGSEDLGERRSHSLESGLAKSSSRIFAHRKALSRGEAHAP